MTGRRTGVCAGLLAAVVLAGCARSHESEDERIRRQAADDARQIRHDANNAGIEARKAAREAGRTARDIVAGVREGWEEGAPAGQSAPPISSTKGSRLDLNAASLAQLETLPGISARQARRIAHERPYKAPADLVERGVLEQSEYDRIADRVAVHVGAHSSSE